MVRVVVIGARRARQGIGHHLARFVAEGGARLVGVVGTSPPTARQAGDALRRRGIETAAFADVEACLDATRPDALVIASPASTHDGLLDLAVARGLHVLCEKPLLWGPADAAERAAAHARAFRERGLHLVVNTQWPHTLTTYRRLFPFVLRSPPRRFAMHLAPDASGVRMLAEAMPHALSLLQAVVPGDEAGLEDIAIERAAGAEEAWDVGFVYRAGASRVASTVRLQRGRTQPRPAAYGFDGHMAARRIDMEGYRMHLEGGGRREALKDPTPRRVAWFLSRIEAQAPPCTDPAAEPGVALLHELCEAFPASAAEPAEEGA